MANPALTISQLANTACVVAMDMGFNAAGVERWLDPETFNPRIAITFGEQQLMRQSRLRTPCEWGLAYSEETPCIRNQRTIEVPEAILYEDTDAIKKRLVESLLETG